jgi:tetratricopeptide (TPR) repeat protein
VIYFRAAMLLDPEDKMAVFGYACACRQWYLSLEGDDEQELVAILKSEAKEYFEWTTELYPDFAGAWYYLGFAWLNEGQYTRAQLIWKRFIALSESEKDSAEYKEIEERLEELKEPVNIERGVNELYAGRFEAGLKILEPYTQTKYNSWWPLHFYLAGAYLELGYTDEAIEGYRKVLELSPSNADAMRMLAKVYAQTGDADMAEKYERKAGIVSEGSGKDDQNTGN